MTKITVTIEADINIAGGTLGIPTSTLAVTDTTGAIAAPAVGDVLSSSGAITDSSICHWYWMPAETIPVGF